MSGPTLACYRDDGLSTLISLLQSCSWMRSPLLSFPPRGFVGRGSSSFQGTALKNYRILSIHLRPIRGTSNALLWRLTFEWETSPPPVLIQPSGLGSVDSGS